MFTRPRVRQLGLGELLDESFRLYRNNFLMFVAIAALVLVPFNLLNFAIQLPFQQQLAQLQQLSGRGTNPFASQSPLEFFSSILFWYLGLIGVGLLYAVVFQPLLEGALARAISRRYLDQPTSVGDGFGVALRRAPALIGARLIPVLFGTLIFGLLALLFAAVIFLIVRAGTSDGAAISRTASALLLALVGLGLLTLLIVVSVAVWVRIFFSSQAVVLEQRGPWESLVRSWRLTQRYFWRTVGYLIVIWLIIYFFAAIPGFVITVPTQLLIKDYRLQLIIGACVNAVFSVLATPFGVIAYTLLYYDLRIRKEGFDIEHQASQLLPPGMTGLAR